VDIALVGYNVIVAQTEDISPDTGASGNLYDLIALRRTAAKTS
jgi:hypothetical protein